jgi:GAF domain-containing protein/HAMP domain-containing protein
MIDRILRRLTVRRRIIGGFLTLVLLLVLSLPLVVTNYRFLVGRLQQVTNVEARADRSLLLASARIASSRINLLRYVQDYAPSPYTALDDVDQAIGLLEEAQRLITSGSTAASPEQKASVEAILVALADYEALIHEIEEARKEGGGQEAVRLEFQAYRFGNDIGQRIELVVKDSEARVAATNEIVFAEAGRRLLYLVVAWTGVTMLGLVLALVITRSITGPVSELRDGAEAFRQGNRDITVPAAGADELSLLARTFNQLTTELSKLYRDLEQRVADRTRELERRSAYLEASAEVGHAATSILETDALIRRAVELIREQFDLYYVGLFLLDGAGEWAVLRAGTGEAGRAMLARGHRIRVGEGMIGWSVAHAQPRLALEAGEDAVRLATAELPETRSEAAIPLRSRGQVLGALTVQDTQPGAFDQDTIAVLQTMADQVGVALDNARLFTESQLALEASRRAYGELSHQAWRELLHARPEWGYIYAHDSIAPAQGDWCPEMLQAVQTSRSVRGRDREEQTLAVPLKVRDDVIGVLSFEKGEADKAWTREEIALIEILVDQLGQALESARLYHDTQRRAERERLTSEVTARMRETLDLETVLKTAVQEVRQAMGLREVVVRLVPEADTQAGNGSEQSGA